MRAALPTRRPRVLLSAFALDPQRGSEEGVGWGWLRAAASGARDVHVLTAAFQRASIEAWCRANPEALPGVTFHYVRPRRFHYRPTPGWKRIESSLLKPLMNLAYAHWLRDAARLARTLHAREAFDLVHLVTYVGYRFPGRYDDLGVPFVWGPLGGIENTPWRFLPSLGLGGAVYYGARNVVNALQRRWLPSPRRALRNAAAVIAATEGVQRALGRCYGVQSEVVTEVGTPEPVATAPTSRAADEALRIVWSGEHQPGKALPFLLEALARLPAEVRWHLTVLGAGRCTRRWRRRADRLGLGARVAWSGWLPRADALEAMRSAHVLAITSLKDLTSTVLLEGLAQGLAVVCPDHCGFANVVDETCGIRLPLYSPRRLVADLAEALAGLARDEPRRRRLARGALQRAEHFTWARKARRLDRIYARVGAAGDALEGAVRAPGEAVGAC